MSAITPSLYQPKGSPGESDGGRRSRGNYLGVATFSSVGNGDTWSSGLEGVTEFAYHAGSASQIYVVNTSGTFTFVVGGVNPATNVKLHIWGRQ